MGYNSNGTYLVNDNYRVNKLEKVKNYEMMAVAVVVFLFFSLLFLKWVN